MNYDLTRFKKAHKLNYEIAIDEIREGKKSSPWMWFIFPQIKGLGRSATAEYYAIENIEEAKCFFDDPVLGANLTEICSALLELETDDAEAVMGYPDDLKLKSSMTLFAEASDSDIFQKVLDKFYHGEKDERTLDLLGVHDNNFCP